MEHLQGMLAGAAVLFGIGGVIWAIGAFLPGLLAKKFHAGFEEVRGSAWLKDQAHPKRLAWFVATLALLEEEIPEPGTGKAFYAPLGEWIAGLLPVLMGTGPKWAAALEKIGDKLDTELDEDLKALAAPPVA